MLLIIILTAIAYLKQNKKKYGETVVFDFLCHVENECVPSLVFKYDIEIIWVVAFTFINNSVSKEKGCGDKQRKNRTKIHNVLRKMYKCELF